MNTIFQSFLEGRKTVEIYPDAQVKTNAEAHAAKFSAKKIRLNVRNKTNSNSELAGIELEIADRLEASADAHLTLEEIPKRGMGGELVSADSSNISTSAEALKTPDRVTLDASIDRLELAHKSGVLNMALDVAESVDATNSAEQMIAHQMAAAHRMSLDLMAKAGNTRDTIEKCRLVNTAAKLMDTYQRAMLVVNRLHTGGQQTVTVQHVQVTDGGQAVINGSVHTGRQLSGRGDGGKK